MNGTPDVGIPFVDGNLSHLIATHVSVYLLLLHWKASSLRLTYSASWTPCLLFMKAVVVSNGLPLKPVTGLTIARSILKGTNTVRIFARLAAMVGKSGSF